MAAISRSDRVRRCHRGEASAGLIDSPVQMPSEAEEEVAQRVRLTPTHGADRLDRTTSPPGSARRKSSHSDALFRLRRPARFPAVISRGFGVDRSPNLRNRIITLTIIVFVDIGYLVVLFFCFLFY